MTQLKEKIAMAESRIKELEVLISKWKKQLKEEK